jgi:hypothetical protein
MNFINAFDKFGPLWILIGVLLTMLFYLFDKVLNVIKSNTEAFSKFSEIISTCEKETKGINRK